MAGVEENGATICDWRSTIHSPRSFFSEDIVSKSFPHVVNEAEPAVIDSEKENVIDKKYGDAAFSGDFPAGFEKFPVGRYGGSIAERRAVRCGFNAPRLNTARFRTTSPLNSPAAVRSPFLMIPAGLSPTALLDSPVMLVNSQVQSSPTTGTYILPSFSHESSMLAPVSVGTIEDKHLDNESSFVFKPHVNPTSMPCLPGAENQVLSNSNQAKQLGMGSVRCQPGIQPQVEFDPQGGLPKKTTLIDNTDFPSDLEISTMIVQSNPMTTQNCTPGVTNVQTSQQERQLCGEDSGGPFPPMGMGRPSEDGYNWRKYGQKQVKGSEYPRSYYKCTHQNCQVKKKVECSHDGQIKEIIYKGVHNHPKPQLNRRTGIGSSFALNDMPERAEDPSSYVKAGGGSAWRSIQQGSKDKSGTNWRANGLERTSSTSVVTEVSDPFSTTQGKHLCLLESADTPELCSTLASHDDEEDRNSQGSISLGDDADDEETDCKRRKMESSLNPIEVDMASRAAREPRVVVQTTSDVDILDDGYRWRKYGQKVVKGNPNPRSYYKCTSAGCSVRKLVERASHDLKSVITTYEGKHNHEVPASRNSNNCNNSGNRNATSTALAPTSITRPAATNIPKPELQVQDLVPRFERIAEKLSDEYLKQGYIGNIISSNIQLGASSACYDTKLLTSQPLSFGSYGLNRNLKEAHQVDHLAQLAPDFHFSFPMGLSHRPANPSLSGLPAQSFLVQHAEGEMRFLRPKEEQEELIDETPRLPINHPSNVYSAVYRHALGGFPL